MKLSNGLKHTHESVSDRGGESEGERGERERELLFLLKSHW